MARSRLLALALVLVAVALLFVVLRRGEERWPRNVVWPAQQLSAQQAEELQTGLYELQEELARDVEDNGGRGVASILAAWRAKTAPNAYLVHVLDSLERIDQGSGIALLHVFTLLDLAFELNVIQHEGPQDVSITRALRGDDDVVSLRGITTGDVREVVLRP